MLTPPFCTSAAPFLLLHTQIKLGSYICVPETKLDEHGKEQETVYVARVIEIFFTVDGQWHVGVHWMYRPCDTLLAHPVKNPKQKKEDKEDQEENEDKQGNCEYEVRVMAGQNWVVVGAGSVGRWEYGVNGSKDVCFCFWQGWVRCE